LQGVAALQPGICGTQLIPLRGPWRALSGKRLAFRHVNQIFGVTSSQFTESVI
jgi:hypothetical protein